MNLEAKKEKHEARLAKWIMRQLVQSMRGNLSAEQESEMQKVSEILEPDKSWHETTWQNYFADHPDLEGVSQGEFQELVMLASSADFRKLLKLLK